MVAEAQAIRARDYRNDRPADHAVPGQDSQAQLERCLFRRVGPEAQEKAIADQRPAERAVVRNALRQLCQAPQATDRVAHFIHGQEQVVRLEPGSGAAAELTH